MHDSDMHHMKLRLPFVTLEAEDIVHPVAPFGLPARQPAESLSCSPQLCKILHFGTHAVAAPSSVQIQII